MIFTTYATIAKHTLAISAHPHSGWHVVKPNASGVTLLEFVFSIQDDGNDNYLLAYSSLDGMFAADTWHETLEDAVACAESLGVERGKWSFAAANGGSK